MRALSGATGFLEIYCQHCRLVLPFLEHCICSSDPLLEIERKLTLVPYLSCSSIPSLGCSASTLSQVGAEEYILPSIDITSSVSYAFFRIADLCSSVNAFHSEISYTNIFGLLQFFRYASAILRCTFTESSEFG